MTCQPRTLSTIKHLILSLLLLASIAYGHEPAAPAPKGDGLKVLVFSDTGYYRHPDTSKIDRWLVLLGNENGFEVNVAEHWNDMRPGSLGQYDVLVLNNANEPDKVLPEPQRKFVEKWFTSRKKGIVGLHAALQRLLNKASTHSPVFTAAPQVEAIPPRRSGPKQPQTPSTGL